MAWGGEPDEAAIQNLIDFTGQAFDRSEAIARLKANSLDVSQAVSEFYDNTASANKYQWDDSVWAADREGNGDAVGPQFNIQGPDVTTSHFETNSAAPTRPPSRTNNRSPLGRLVDLTAIQAAGAPTTHAEEDADLKRALAESAAESGLPPQESGIIGGDVNEINFGPATRSEYEQDQWALVPTKAEAATTQRPELLPSARKREPSAPAFLRATKAHRLAAILTILHQIPLARNALLSCGTPARSYGYSNEWWEGKAIVKQESLQASNQDNWTTHLQENPEFHDELHRLVAFLDSTDRAYGSADGLASTTAIDPNQGFGWGNVDVEERFFEVLKTEYEEAISPLLKPFMNIAKTERVIRAPTDDQSADPEDAAMIQSADSDASEEALFNFLTIPLLEGQSQSVTSLYNALDSIFWCDAFSKDVFPTDTSNTAFMSDIGEFFIVRIGGDGLCKPCDVPITLYADRYTESRKDLAITTQIQLHRLRDLLSRADESEKRVLACSGETGCRERKWYDGQQHSARDCWAKSIEASEAFIQRQRKRAQLRYTQDQLAQGKTPSMKDIALIHSGASPYELTDEEREAEDVLKRGIELAQYKLADIDHKLEYINERRQQFMEALEHLSVRLTVREEDAPQEFVDNYIVPNDPQYYKKEYWNPTYKYLLRGVATTNEITYVCTRRDADLIEVDNQAEPRDQWWRLVYAAEEKNPISVEKTDAESVSIAAGSESKYPLLIYASEAAIDANPVQLSDALRTFVRADNKVFQNELSQEQVQAESHTENFGQTASQGDGPVPLTADAISTVAPVAAVPWSPSKRKHSDASSVATVGSTNSRGMEMSFSDTTGPFPDHDEPSSWHQEFASPQLQPNNNKISGLVEPLENCRTFEPESPVLGRRAPVNQEMKDMTARTDKSPEMQERTTGPSPFVVSRPVLKASEAASAPISLMDMEMDISTEHHEG